MTMYIQVGQSEGDFMRQVQETYFTRSTASLADPAQQARKMAASGKSFYSPSAMLKQQLASSYSNHTSTLNLECPTRMYVPVAAIGRGRYQRSAAAGTSTGCMGGVSRMYQWVCRVLRDDRIHGTNASASTIQMFTRINTHTGRHKCLEDTLNVVYLTIGILLFTGVVLGLVHALLVTTFNINVLHVVGLTTNSTTNFEFTFVRYPRSTVIPSVPTTVYTHGDQQTTLQYLRHL